MKRLAWSMLLAAACGAPQAAKPDAAVRGAPSATARAADAAPGVSLCTASSKSVPASPDTIARVQVHGNTRVAAAALCDAIQSRAGELADVEKVQADLRRLWGTGEIDDVFVSSEQSELGRVLTYEVRERAVVKAWHLDGFRAIDAARVRDRLGPAGKPFNGGQVSDTIARLRVEYLALGYRSADIQQRVEKAGADQVEVYVTAAEGPVATIKSIQVQGVSKARATELMTLIETGAGTYNAPGKLYRSDSLEADRVKMLEWFFDRGMVAAAVEPEKVTMSPDRTALELVIQVAEGPVYRVGKVSFSGDLAAPEAKYLELLGTRKGQVFSRAELIKGVQRVQEFEVQNQRHGKINPRTEIDPKKQLVDLTMVLER